MNRFECERTFIEDVVKTVQRNILIAEYCDDDFQYVKLVDIYYRKIDSNAIFMFLMICISFPVFFMAISAIAEKYLSVGMQDLSRRFNLSPTIAATTLIAFANGAPDVLAAFSSGGASGAAFISIGALFGAFIFNSTLVIANILMSINTEIVLSKWAVLKEITFYALAVIIILIFGLIQSTGYTFVAVYLTAYGIYILATIKVESWDNKEKAELARLEGSDLEANPNKALTEGDNPKDELKIEEAGEESDDVTKGGLGALTAEILDEEAGLFQNAVLLPLQAAGLVLVPYLTNPLMKTHLRFVINTAGLLFTLVILEVFELSWTVALVCAGIAAVLEGLHVANIKRTWLETTYEIIAVFAAIAGMKIFATLIIDSIAFLAFYFSISKVVLNTLLLSAGNCLGDFFGNAALAMQGETVMAAMASYSGQIFNIFVGLSMNVLVATGKGNTEFDIFGLKEKAAGGSIPIDNIYVMLVAAYVGLVLVLNTLYYFSNKFVLKRKFGMVLFGVYGVFFVSSLAFALIFRKDT
jgi:sodium/potassium/calcium exchanger 6